MSKEDYSLLWNLIKNNRFGHHNFKRIANMFKLSNDELNSIARDIFHLQNPYLNKNQIIDSYYWLGNNNVMMYP